MWRRTAAGPPAPAPISCMPRTWPPWPPARTWAPPRPSRSRPAGCRARRAAAARAGAGQGRKDKQPAPPTARPPQERKAINDAVAYIRSLAELRGRNADWAEKAVREAATLTASAALKEGVIDLIAGDVTSCSPRSTGAWSRPRPGEVRLETRGRRVVELKPDWKTADHAGDLRSQHRAHPDDDRHLRHPVRVLEPRRGGARRDRRHLPDRGAGGPVGAAGQLRRASPCSCSALR